MAPQFSDLGSNQKGSKNLIMHSLKKGYWFLKNNLPENYSHQIDAVLGKQARVFDQAKTNDQHKIFYKDARVIQESELIQEVHKTFFFKSDPNMLIPESNANFVQSTVPYIHGKTSVFLYNFFDKNYGVRDPILYRFLLIDSSRQVVAIQNIILGSFGLYHSDFKSGLFPNQGNLPSNAMLVIQGFHPKAKIRGNQIRFFSFYGNDSNELTCGVHSLRFHVKGMLPRGAAGYRRKGFLNDLFSITYDDGRAPWTLKEKESASNLAEKNDLLEHIPGNPIVGVPYLFHFDKQGNPYSVWHDGPTPHFVKNANQQKKIGPVQTAFLVPDFLHHAPLLLLDHSQIGFIPHKITISARELSSGRTQTKNLPISSLPYSIDTAELFSEYSLSGDISFVVDFNVDIGQFDSVPEGMVQIYYRSKHGWGDQTHSHHGYGLHNDPKHKVIGHRCLKYAPFLLNQNLRNTYSIIHLGGKSGNTDHSLFIRILSDTGAEVRFELEVPQNTVYALTQEMILEKIGNQINEIALIQLEHPTTNFNGNWYIQNLKLGTIACDHFTGG